MSDERPTTDDLPMGDDQRIADERQGSAEQPAIPQLPEGTTTPSYERLQFALTAVLGVALLLALVGTAFVAVSPPAVGTAYTELYLLDEGGVAADYPTNVTVGEEATVLVGVANHERDTVDYEIVVRADDQTLASQSRTLSDGDRWEEPVTYSIDDPGPTEVQFLLYRGDASTADEPYRSTRLVVNVTE